VSDVILTDFGEVTADEVANAVRKLPNKSSPLDLLPTSLLKLCIPEVMTIIANMANASFSSGRFPAKMKIGQITPLLKKPGLDEADNKNFRPITNLSTVSKLLERLTMSRLQPHLLRSPNYCPLQSAYRPSHSTETAVVKVADDLYRAMDNGAFTALVSLDISAAFVTIDHEILRRRLKSDFHVDGNALAWIKSYVSDRYSFVQVGQSASDRQHCSAGVPQGSVLGPLLFTAYTSPVGRVINTHGIQYHSYADDTQLYIRLADPLSIRRLEGCTTDLQHWFARNKLMLNGDKSDVIIIGTAQRHARAPPPTHLTVAGCDITAKEHLQLLGVTIDNRMSFNKHVTLIVRACNYHTWALRHIRPVLSYDVAQQIACSIVGSKLDYCNALLHGGTSGNIGKLQRVQNNLARVVCRRDRSADAAQLLQQLHWLPVDRRVEFKVAKLCYQAINCKQPTYLADLLIPYSQTRTLRSGSRDLLHVPPHNIDIAARRFSVAAPRLWNTLPLNIRTAPSVASFKRLLKTYLFALSFNS